MWRRSIFLLAFTLVVLYFSLIVFMLTPLHGARSDVYNNNLALRRIPSLNWCKDLRLRSPPFSEVVALVSFPGSGNTWLRYLLQQATGIATGSIYLDFGLRDHGFPAETVTDGRVLVVKTHDTPSNHNFNAAVLLVRNPRDAILAEFNRIHSGHVGVAPDSAFKKKSQYLNVTAWEAYVWNKLHKWRAFHNVWLLKFPGRVFVVEYEVLTVDTKSTLFNICEFLNQTISEEDMSCVLSHKEGIYRRKHKSRHFDPFTSQMYEEIEKVRDEVFELIRMKRGY